MSRFSDFLKNIVPPPNQNKQTGQDNKTNNSSTNVKPFVPKTNVWTPNAASTSSSSETATAQSNSPAPVIKDTTIIGESQSKTVNVPVYQNDTEWSVIQRGLGMMADEAGVGGDSKLAFVRKWSGELERTGQPIDHLNNLPSIDSNEDSNKNSVVKIDKTNFSQATLWMETYPLTIRPDFQARASSDLQALRHVEMFGVNITDPRLRSEVKAVLREIIIGSNEVQGAAAQKLLLKAEKGQPEADKIYEVTRALSCIGEMRFNAALNMAKLKMDADKFQQLNHQGSATPHQTPKTFIKEPIAQQPNNFDYNENNLPIIGNPKHDQADQVNKDFSKLLNDLK